MVNFIYSDGLEYKRLIDKGIAIRTGQGLLVNQETGTRSKQPIPYCRVQFAYPRRTEYVWLTFTDKASTKTAEKLLARRLVLADSNDEYNKIIREFMAELQSQNPLIPEFLHGDEAAIAVGGKEDEPVK